jgi:hypothetical protein
MRPAPLANLRGLPLASPALRHGENPQHLSPTRAWALSRHRTVKGFFPNIRWPITRPPGAKE